MSGEILPFTDPLLELLKDPDLNKEADKAKELVRYIEDIEDSKLKAWCIEAFEILRDLEKIEVKINNWEFQTLDLKISVDQIMLEKEKEEEEESSSRKMNAELAKRVAKHCLDFHHNLIDLGVEIDELSAFSRALSAVQKISDPGTILTELNLRVIQLQSVLTDQISIHYSRARLVNIGMSLEELVGEEGGSSNINTETVRNYRKFVNNLLKQLNSAVGSGDTIGAMECIAIVNDVEKMFLTMKAQSQAETSRRILDKKQREEEKRRLLADEQQRTRESELKAALQKEREKAAELERKTAESASTTNSSSVPMSPQLDESQESTNDGNAEFGNSIDSDTDSSAVSMTVGERRKRRLNNDKMKMNLEDSILHKTTLAEKLPMLMSAFTEAKAAESGLKKVVSQDYGAKSPHKRQKSSHKSGPSSPRKHTSTPASPKKRATTPPPPPSASIDMVTSTPVKEKTEEEESGPKLQTSAAEKTTTTKTATTETIEEPKSEDEEVEVDDGFEDAETDEVPEMPDLRMPPRMPLPGPSVLKAFFQPTVKEPIFIPAARMTQKQAQQIRKVQEAQEQLRLQEQQQQQLEQEKLRVARAYRRLDGPAVRKKLLFYQKDEQLRDLRLSTEKLNSIEVGRGRVKETVKEIEQQLPTDAKPPAPKKLDRKRLFRTASGRQGSDFLVDEDDERPLSPSPRRPEFSRSNSSLKSVPAKLTSGKKFTMPVIPPTPVVAPYASDDGYEDSVD